MNNFMGTGGLSQNILKITARCIAHGITKVFFSSVLLCTRKVSNNVVAKLNLDIANICKDNIFHFSNNNNMPFFWMKMVYIYHTHVKIY